MLLPIIYSAILSSISILWTLIVIPFLFFGYSFYLITEINTITTISKNIKYSIIRDDREDPSGFFIGWYYIGYIFTSTKDSEKGLLYCLCTSSQFKELNKKKDAIIIETDKFIDLYTKKGSYYYPYYKKRILNCTHIIPNEKQDSIINKIIEYYKLNNKGVFMISGKPGTGKSIMGILLAKILGGSLCKTYNPTIPGDNFENVYNQIDPTINNPLILLIDEFDVIIHSFHTKKLVQHKNISTEVYNKTTWNNLFDDISIKVYANVIVILTTNLTRETIEKNYDPSYIREKRINLEFTL